MSTLAETTRRYLAHTHTAAAGVHKGNRSTVTVGPAVDLEKLLRSVVCNDDKGAATAVPHWQPAADLS